jgi:hypothetical protein
MSRGGKRRYGEDEQLTTCSQSKGVGGTAAADISVSTDSVTAVPAGNRTNINTVPNSKFNNSREEIISVTSHNTVSISKLYIVFFVLL